MKNHLLPAIFCGLFIMPWLFCPAQTDDTERSVVVLQLDALDGERNISLHSHFNDSEYFRLINSCEALSLVVFDSQLPVRTARQRLRQEMGALGIEDAEILVDKTATEVMIECRQRMQEMLDPTGGG